MLEPLCSSAHFFVAVRWLRSWRLFIRNFEMYDSACLWQFRDNAAGTCISRVWTLMHACPSIGAGLRHRQSSSATCKSNCLYHFLVQTCKLNCLFHSIVSG
jgi:hypothetical protein